MQWRNRVSLNSQTIPARITQLDGWRGVSILFVIYGHVAEAKLGPPYSDLSVLAGWGVTSFFVISGFIITRLALAETETNGVFSTKRFYVRRALRIVPPLFAYLAVLIALGLIGVIDFKPAQATWPALFVCDVYFHCNPFVSHTWTLAIEEQFYLLFPLLMAFFASRLRTAYLVLAAMLILVPCVRYLALADSVRSIAALSSSFIFICAGAIAATSERRIDVLASSRAGPFVSLAAFLAIVVLIALSAAKLELGGLASLFRYLLTLTAAPAAVGWLIAASIYQRGLWVRALTSKPLVFVGVISYSLYLWQQLFVVNQEMHFVNSILFNPAWMFVPATISYFLIERPFSRFAKRLRLKQVRQISPAALS